MVEIIIVEYNYCLNCNKYHEVDETTSYHRYKCTKCNSIHFNFTDAEKCCKVN